MSWFQYCKFTVLNKVILGEIIQIYSFKIESMNYIAQAQHKLKLLWSSRLGHLRDSSSILLLFDPNGLRITSSKLMFDRCKTL